MNPATVLSLNNPIQVEYSCIPYLKCLGPEVFQILEDLLYIYLWIDIDMYRWYRYICQLSIPNPKIQNLKFYSDPFL